MNTFDFLTAYTFVQSFVAARMDWKTYKIPDVFPISIFIFTFLEAIGRVITQNIGLSNFVMNLLMTTAFGIGLALLNGWRGGDLKMFLAISPLQFFKKYPPLIFSAYFLLRLCIVLAVFMFLFSIFKKKKAPGGVIFPVFVWWWWAV